MNPLSLSVYTCLQRGHWSQSHKTWNAEIFPAGLRCIFPRTGGAGPEGSPQWASFPTLRPCQRRGRRKHSLLLRNLFCERQHRPARVQREAVFREPPQFRSQLICLITSGWPHACLQGSRGRKTERVAVIRGLSEGLFEPSVWSLCGQFSPLTSKNPMTTTSAELMKALAASASLSQGRPPSGSTERVAQ